MVRVNFDISEGHGDHDRQVAVDAESNRIADEDVLRHSGHEGNSQDAESERQRAYITPLRGLHAKYFSLIKSDKSME